ncbi:mevalonate kinase family protein [Neptuniibacter halophilus]|uniref:mevalonate kinase family protein n=1 Tax=Neptuniibacter halophilus TaxID=651666 RepID=UPI002573913A|nr:mevalonate kinase [Neptuniibacter halophilus]
MKAKAPGKMILSGEHSVVYGAPAIAVAVDQSVTARFTPSTGSTLELRSSLGEYSQPLTELESLSDQLDSRYDAFLQHRLGIREVLQHPLELISYTLAQAGFSSAGVIDINSTIPAGAGMGSSAALIAALLKLAQGNHEEDSDPERFFRTVRYCERLQHGRGSAIDAAAVTYGGLIRVCADEVTPLPYTLGRDWYIWNSGSPQSSTGETVAAVRAEFEGAPVWSAFSAVTEALQQALQNADQSALPDLIRSNQLLLEQIGVVPEPVAETIRQVVALGGAGKVCGAGSLGGKAAGQVLFYLPGMDVQSISQWLRIDLQPLRQVNQGACFEAY